MIIRVKEEFCVRDHDQRLIMASAVEGELFEQHTYGNTIQARIQFNIVDYYTLLFSNKDMF